MPFHFENLDVETRRLMVEELQRDIDLGLVYRSPSLNNAGLDAFPGLLRDAFTSGNDQTLGAAIRSSGFLNATEWSTRNGRPIEKRMRSNAHEMLAEGEFTSVLRPRALPPGNRRRK